jgi:hypothetical protein
VKDNTKDELMKSADFKDKRTLAKEFDTSETEIQRILSENGFTILEDFTADEKIDSSLDLNYEIREMEKRKLQGLFGEKIAVFIKGRIEKFLKNSFGDGWQLRKGIKLKTEKVSNPRSMWYGDRHADSGISISDSTIRHRNMEKEKIRRQVRDKHFITSEELFNQFAEHQIPSIDQVYYVVKFSGMEKARTYHLVNSESSSYSNQSREKINLKHVEDFKIIGLEIKTTENKAENLFSNLQRSLRDKASESPYLDIYGLKVEYNIDSREIPDEVDIRIEKCDS